MCVGDHSPLSYARRISPACFHCNAFSCLIKTNVYEATLAICVVKLFAIVLFRRLSPLSCFGDYSPLSCFGDIRHCLVSATFAINVLYAGMLWLKSDTFVALISACETGKQPSCAFRWQSLISACETGKQPSCAFRWQSLISACEAGKAALLRFSLAVVFSIAIQTLKQPSCAISLQSTSRSPSATMDGSMDDFERSLQLTEALISDAPAPDVSHPSATSASCSRAETAEDGWTPEKAEAVHRLFAETAEVEAWSPQMEATVHRLLMEATPPPADAGAVEPTLPLHPKARAEPLLPPWRGSESSSEPAASMVPRPPLGAPPVAKAHDAGAAGIGAALASRLAGLASPPAYKVSGVGALSLLGGVVPGTAQRLTLRMPCDRSWRATRGQRAALKTRSLLRGGHRCSYMFVTLE